MSPCTCKECVKQNRIEMIIKIACYIAVFSFLIGILLPCSFHQIRQILIIFSGMCICIPIIIGLIETSTDDNGGSIY